MRAPTGPGARPAVTIRACHWPGPSRSPKMPGAMIALARRVLVPFLVVAVAACCTTDDAEGTGGADLTGEPATGTTPDGAAPRDPLDPDTMAGDPEPPNDPKPPIAFDAGTATATLAGDGESVEVAVEVPTGGHELEVDDVVLAGGVATVRLKLTTPGEGELVTEAFQTHRVDVDLPAACGRCVVRIATWQRGVEYFVPPEAKVAAVVDRE